MLQQVYVRNLLKGDGFYYSNRDWIVRDVQVNKAEDRVIVEAADSNNTTGILTFLYNADIFIQERTFLPPTYSVNDVVGQLGDAFSAYHRNKELCD